MLIQSRQHQAHHSSSCNVCNWRLLSAPQVHLGEQSLCKASCEERLCVMYQKKDLWNEDISCHINKQEMSQPSVIILPEPHEHTGVSKDKDNPVPWFPWLSWDLVFLPSFNLLRIPWECVWGTWAENGNREAAAQLEATFSRGNTTLWYQSSWDFKGS